MDSGKRWGFAPTEIDTKGELETPSPLRRLTSAQEAERPRKNLHETSDDYSGVIAHLCARHRVIECKDAIQWILQQRRNGGAERPWRGIGYFRNRNALVRVSATLCGRIDPAAMAILAALPDVIGGPT